MSVCRFVVTFLSIGLALACSRGSEPEKPATPPVASLETLRAALTERDELERKYLLTSYLRTLDPQDLPAALEEIEKHRVGFDSEEVRLLMFAWCRFDGAGAFATAKNWPSPWRSVLIEEAMHAWAFHDGPAALAELGTITDDELRETLHAAMMSGWVGSRDPLGAAAVAAQVSDFKRRSRLAFRLAGEVKRDGPDALIAFVDGVPEDAPNDFKATLFGHASGMVARIDPQIAAAWFEREIDRPYTAGGLQNIASKWAQFHDPRALIEWVGGLSGERLGDADRAIAVGTAYRIWAADDPDAAADAVDSIQAGPLRDAAIDELARALAEQSPAEALRWSQQIEDDVLRRKRTLRYTRKWFMADSVAFDAWFAEADLPVELRLQVSKNLPHTGAAAGTERVE